MQTNTAVRNINTLQRLPSPKYIHVPALYEESTTVINWQSIVGAAGYELEQSLDGNDFSLVFSGMGIEMPSPDQGLTWANIRSKNMTWNEIEHIGAENNGLAWHELSLLLTMGLNWSQFDSENKTWLEFETEGFTWGELEQFSTRGLTWNSIDASWLNWSEWENNDLTWSEFENLPADNVTRIACEITIPLYSKYSQYRVRAYDENGNYSTYKATGIINHLPRSLANVRPDCLHIPSVLHEGSQAKIIWSELYGASQYILERSLDGGLFNVIYDGIGTPVPPPFGGFTWKEIESKNQTWSQFEAKNKSWFDLESELTPGLIWGNANALQLTWEEIENKELTWNEIENLPPHNEHHLAFIDMIPWNSRKVTYRIKAYNTTDSSQCLTSCEETIVLLFNRDDLLQINTANNTEYLIQISAENAVSFGEAVITLEYSATHLQLLESFDYHSFAISTGDVPEIKTQIISHSNGKIRFQIARQNYLNMSLSGLVTLFKFRAKTAGSSSIKMY